MERVRQGAAIITGILVIIILVLLARWTGNRIREKFLTPKPAAVTIAPKQSETISSVPLETPAVSQDQFVKISTYSAIPSTGPADFGYFFIGLLFLSGVSISALTKRFS